MADRASQPEPSAAPPTPADADANPPGLRLHLLAGRDAGRRLRLDSPVIDFGREHDNRLVLDESFVSRHHGELRYDPDAERWLLVNHSPNGLKAGVRAVKGSRPLKPGAEVEVRVAEHPLFRVEVEQPGAAPDPTPDGDASASPGKTPSKKKLKLWIGIGGYLAVMAVVFVVLANLGGDETPTATGLRPLTDEQIATSLGAEPEPSNPPIQSVYLGNLEDARRQHARKDYADDALVGAYAAFRAAMAANEGRLEDRDVLRYAQVRDETVALVQSKYSAAYRQYTQGRYREAIRRFDELSDLLREADRTDVIDNVRAFRARAAARLAD